MAILKLTEEQFLEQVIELAKLYGWMVYHTRPAWTNKGYRTPTQGDKGFPDLVLSKNGVTFFAELKADGKEPTAEQWQWIISTGASIWHPADLDSIIEILKME